MPFKKAEIAQGVRIVVGTYRKSSGGEYRHGRTGKKAAVHVPGKEPVHVKGATLKALRVEINKVVRIPTGVQLAKYGETYF